MTDKVDVIVPVYRNAGLTRACIDSIINARDVKLGDLIVINDASPEAELADYCTSLAEDQGISVVCHDKNLGFVTSVNEGMQISSTRDVVLLNSDTQVSGNWITRLHAAAYSESKCASVTPFSNNATICSYPNFGISNPIPSGLSFEQLDALFAMANPGQTVEIPSGVGFCMYMKREALEEVGLFDEEAFGRGYGEENDWCLRASRMGWKHALCADLFVYHEGGASFGEGSADLQASATKVIEQRYPDYHRQIADFVERDPAEPMRHAVDLARSDRTVVISEYRQRELATRAARYELDRQRHQQVTALDDLLAETRALAETERKNYERLLVSTRQDSANKEEKYQAQIHKMAEGYKALEADSISLERDLRDLRGFWPVRVRRWLQRRLGG